MQVWKFRGCRRTDRRCVPALRTATYACRMRPIDSPLVTSPNFLVAMNEPSLRKFDKSVRPGGWVIYNGDVFPAGLRARRHSCARACRLPELPMSWATRGPPTW